MNIGLGIMEGFREILAHKFRSFLTMLGIILGVSSLMSMFALTAGIAANYRDTLNQVGGVERVEIRDSPVPAWQEGLAEISPGRTYRDALALRQSATLLSWVSPEIELGATLRRANYNARPRLLGVEPDFLHVDKHEVSRGRFISDLDLLNKNRVVVLGNLVVEQLWPESGADPVGEIVYINDVGFRVIGTFTDYKTDEEIRAEKEGIKKGEEQRRKERGQTGRGWRGPLGWKNNTCVIPLTTMQAIFKSANVVNGTDEGPNLKIDRLTVQIQDVSQFDGAIDQMRNVLNHTHRGIQDFGFNTREDWFDSIERSVRAMQFSGGLIAGISLLVGGLGITNIMLASISERVREIGIRRAVGARGRDIFIQILIESTVLAVFGGLLGILTAKGLIQLLILIAPVDNNPIIEPLAVVISLGFALMVGVLAGIYPAWIASRLSPIEALRYE